MCPETPALFSDGPLSVRGFRINSERRPDLDRVGPNRKLKARLHHADDLEQFSIQRHGAPNHIRVCAEPLLPQTIADDSCADRAVSANFLIRPREDSAQ